MGSLDPAAGHTFPTDHVYFVLSNPGAYPPPYEVKAPADGIITRIDYYRLDWPEGSGHSGKYDDYRMIITHTNTFQSYYAHMAELAEWIHEQCGELNPNDFTNVRIPVHAGDIVGKAGGRPGAQYCLDMGAMDSEVELYFIHPEKYDQTFTVHAVCPLDYFEADIRDALYSKVERTAEPRGGKIDFDQPGKLVGGWFLEGTAEFGEQELTATIIVQVVDAEKTKVEAFEVHPTNPEFTSNAKYYIR